MEEGVYEARVYTGRPSLLCAIGGHFLRVIVVRDVCVAPIGVWALWHLSCHRYSNDFQPALLQFIRFSGKVVDKLGLGQAEAGRRVRGPGGVLHGVAQQRDGRLCLHVLREQNVASTRRNQHIFPFIPLGLYLRSAVQVEHHALLLGNDAPHPLPRFVLLTVLQEATYDAAACDLRCLDLHRKSNPASVPARQNGRCAVCMQACHSPLGCLSSCPR